MFNSYPALKATIEREEIQLNNLWPDYVAVLNGNVKVKWYQFGNEEVYQHI